MENEKRRKLSHKESTLLELWHRNHINKKCGHPPSTPKWVLARIEKNDVGDQLFDYLVSNWSLFKNKEVLNRFIKLSNTKGVKEALRIVSEEYRNNRITLM